MKQNQQFHKDMPQIPQNQIPQSEKPNEQKNYNYLYFKEMQNLKNYRKEIQKKMQLLNFKKNDIYQKVNFYEKKTQEQFRDYIRGQAPERKKRNRRNADQIQRQYNCPTCGKKYGSQGSMHQHIKLKHPDYYEPQKRNSKKQSQNQNNSSSYSN